MTDDFKSFHLAALIAGILLIWFSNDFLLFRDKSKVIGSVFLPTLYIFFAISLLLSLIASQELSIVITIVGLLLILWCCTVLIPNYCKKNSVSLNSIYVLIILSLLIVFLYSMVRYGIRTVNYEGVFTNQNALGGNAATLFCISSACFLDNFRKEEKNTKKLLWLSVISMLIAVVLAFFATSRTSVISILICFAVSLLIFLAQGLNRKYAIKVFLIMITVAIIIGFVYYFTSFRGVVDRLLYKFTLNEGDQLNGRQELWDVILGRLSFFGNGEDSSIAAHNTYLSLIDQYGLISGGLWVLFCAFGILISFSNILKKQNRYKYLPFLAFLIFSIQSMTEGMMLKTIMLIVVFSISILINNRNYSGYCIKK